MSDKLRECSPQLNWEQAAHDGSSSMYASQVEEIVKPLLGRDYTSVAEIESDLVFVCKAMVSISSTTIPPMKPFKNHHGKRHIKDSFLSHLCWKSRVAFHEWKETGCPTTGPVYDNRKDCKRRVSEHVSKCKTREKGYPAAR